MTATNHGLSGALIGLSVTQPVVALPLALASHFLLDTVPHFGFRSYEERKKHARIFNFYVKADFVLPLSVIVGLILFGASWLVVACALVAISPDLFWLYRFLVLEKGGKVKPSPHGIFTKFHKEIQKFEFMGGFWIEVVFATLMVVLLTINWQ